MDIRDAVVIITGASEGLGEASARLFTNRGARVALAARSHDKLNQMAKELPGSFAIPVDLRESAAIAQMVAAVQDHYGRIDLLINNAAQGMHGFLEQAADNIRVGVVYPGMMATDMNRHLLPASSVKLAAVAWEAGGELPAVAPGAWCGVSRRHPSRVRGPLP